MSADDGGRQRPRDTGDRSDWREGFRNANDPHRSDSGPRGRDSGAAMSQRHPREKRASRPDYRGRGPRNYRRPDERIREDVNDRLTEAPWLDASDIDVQVRDGDVTLRGHVTTREQRRGAEDAICELPGVRDVLNELRVRPEHGRHEPWMLGTTAEHRPGDRGTLSSTGTLTAEAVQAELRPGMTVADREDFEVGTVRSVGDQEFLLDRRNGAALEVPFSAIFELRAARALLDRRQMELDQQGWPSPGVSEGAGRSR